MHAVGGEIIYVGKAKNLKNRVSSYFLKTDHPPKVAAMVSHVADFEFIITNSESEAFVLENNLIKEHKPKYNILLKDDKNYLSIQITTQEEYPRLILTRKRVPDGSRYFGPYTTGQSAKELVRILKKIFRLPHCGKQFPRDMNKDRPCLYHDMGSCDALCSGAVSPEEHAKKIEGVISFLSGNQKKLILELEEQMLSASENLEFERAAVLRDEIAGLKGLSSKQLVSAADGQSMDMIAAVFSEGDACVYIFHIRGGLLLGNRTYTFTQTSQMDESVFMSNFLTQLYAEQEIPPSIYVSILPDDSSFLEEEFSKKRGSKVSLIVPQRGEKKDLLQLGLRNAKKALQDYKLSELSKTANNGILEELKSTLKLSTTPLRIESYDISHISGTDTVGVMIVYDRAKPDKNSYRKFNLTNHKGDTDSQRELLFRRFSHAEKETDALIQGTLDEDDAKFALLPDLILIDGGTQQVHVCEEVMKDFGLSIPVFGLVKDDKHRTRAVTDADGYEASVIPGSPLFRFLTAMQDEVHRYAITTHRKKREKKLSQSDLSSIPGVGEKRQAALLRYFGSIAVIRGKNEKEIAACPGIDKKTAAQIYAWFHKKD